MNSQFKEPRLGAVWEMEATGQQVWDSDTGALKTMVLVGDEVK